MTDDQISDCSEDPLWLLELPDTNELIAPPVEPREQLLPLELLTWQSFERLCLKLAGKEGDAEHWRLYGKEGQEQGGIDIYVRRKSTTKYAVWQSKRHKSFTKSKLDAAVQKFLDGSWSAKSDRFVLCVQASLNSIADGIETWTATLRQTGIEFLAKDGEELSRELKYYPEIVDDFFGRAWVERFCGKEAAAALAHRLQPKDVIYLKTRLRNVYAAHFGSVDPGVLSQLPPSVAGRKPLQLADRYVVPDVFLGSDLPSVGQSPAQKPALPDPEIGKSADQMPPVRVEAPLQQEKVRMVLENWLAELRRDVVLGTAGTGKSTLLRFIALDMLAEEPRLSGLRRRLPDYLPVWVSFAFWTKLIAVDKDKSSLLDAIGAWFHRQDEPELVELVRKALQDKRLVLLVDGIDEWQNETAANTALSLLQTFVEVRDIAVIVTSRPHGYRLMTALTALWRVASIAPLTADQQTDLAAHWFAHLEPHSADHVRVRDKSRRQADDFITELQCNGPMAQLGATPLLLTGLVALKMVRLQLPRNRFSAYEALAKLLLEIHPTARDKAAFAGSPRASLDPTMRETALAALAYAIHNSDGVSTPDSVEMERAISLVSQCLTERFGFLSHDAVEKARAFLNLGEEEIGILVKKSPREIGFFHRVFQEFMAAQHIASWAFDRQIDLVGSHAADPGWSNVILCLLHQISRPDETNRLLTVIRSIEGDPTAVAIRDLLLAEVTFGEFKVSPQVAAQFADLVFQQIELGRWPSFRRELAIQAIDGLSSPVVGSRVAQKVAQWFPRWHTYGLGRAFQIIGSWPNDADVESALWRGMHDEFYSAAEAAALAYAKRFGGRGEQEKSLRKLISSPASISSAGLAIEALWRGWPQAPALNDILDSASKSDSSYIAIAGIRGRISLGKHTDKDLTYLIEVFERDEYSTNGLAARALVEGWKGDERLRDYVEHGRPGGGARFGRMAGRRNYWLLARAFPGDPKVAELIATDFEQDYPRAFVDERSLGMLTSFRGNANVEAAVEAWALKYRTGDDYTLSHVARIAPTANLKKELLKSLESEKSLKFWGASALIDLWGAADGDVRETLMRCADTPVKERSGVGHVLPLIMEDKRRCRDLLLEIVAHRNIRADFALEGLRILGIDASDRETADRVLERGYDEQRFVLENEVREVIPMLKADERVVALAKRQLQREAGVIDVVAEAYSDSAEMRQLVLNAAHPLDVNLRATLLEQLASRAAYDPSSRALVAAARLEEDDEIIAGAAIAYAHAAKRADLVNAEYVTELQEELKAVGPRLDARRQGALGASAIIGRFDLIKERKENSVFDSIGMRKHAEIIRTVASEWAGFVDAFGGDDAALDALRVARKDIFEVFGSHLDASSAIRAFGSRVVDELSGRTSTAAIRFAERVRPGSALLRDLCFANLTDLGPARTTWNDWSSIVTAGEVLGRNFAGDADIEKTLLQRLGGERGSGILTALSEGWSSEASLAAQSARLNDDSSLPYPVKLRLVATCGQADRLANALVLAANELTGDLWDAIPYWIPAMIRRLRKDDAAHSEVFSRLSSQPSPGMKASFPQLLSRSRGLSEELRDWCLIECNRSDHDTVGEVGLDLITGQYRLVTQCLFELLSGGNG